MPLCAICDNLDLRNLTDWENDVQDIPHQKSLVALKQSSSSCTLCKLIFKELCAEQPLVESESAMFGDSPIIIRGRQYLDEESNQGGIYMLKVRCDKARVRALFSLYADECCTPPVPADVIIGRAIRPAEERFDLLKQWIDNCEAQHSLCRVQRSQLPTRIIDVGDFDADEPYLKVTSGELGRYVALSHCWGEFPLIRTTKGTLAQHRLGLPMDQLPKTFRDAVTVTRMLNLRYLWIDSLCIIQDDVSDWERESAVMGQIYSQAYLTVAAAAARNGNGGCFLLRSSDTHVRVKCSVGSGEESYVFIREKPKGFDELDHSILNTRAWVTQERLLSPRTIHYDVDQMLWECRESRYAEDTVPVDAFKVQKLVWDGRLHVKYPHSREGASNRRFVWDWYDLIENYTTRSLTRTNDKLPAISGLATVMERRTGDRYVAGLWQSHLNIGLLWHRKKEWLVQAATYRAPSWSWAAFDGHITMPSEADIESTILMKEISEVHTAVIKPKGFDPHGMLEYGFLTITAPLEIADPRTNPQSELYKSYEEQPIKEHLYCKGESVGWAIFDEVYRPTGPIHCLQITLKALPVLDLCYSLLLEPIPGGNDFVRVGLGCPTRSGWYDNSTTKTIRIV